jgi:hypothetical protein
MIKVKYIQLDNETVKILNNLIEIDMNADIAFKLSKIIKDISLILENRIEGEKEIMNKWARKEENGDISQVKDKDGNIIPGVIDITDTDSFNKDISAFLETEYELPYDKIQFESTGIKTIKIKDIFKLDFIFE